MNTRRHTVRWNGLGRPVVEHEIQARELGDRAARAARVAQRYANDGRCKEAISELTFAALMQGKAVESADSAGGEIPYTVQDGGTALKQAEGAVIRLCIRS